MPINLPLSQSCLVTPQIPLVLHHAPCTIRHLSFPEHIPAGLWILPSDSVGCKVSASKPGALGEAACGEEGEALVRHCLDPKWGKWAGREGSGGREFWYFVTTKWRCPQLVVSHRQLGIPYSDMWDLYNRSSDKVNFKVIRYNVDEML